MRLVFALTQITLKGVSVLVNPFADLDAKIEAEVSKRANPTQAAAEEKAKRAAEDGEAWFNHQVEKPKPLRAGVGMYIAAEHLKGVGAVAASSQAMADPSSLTELQLAEPPKKKPKSSGFGDFNGW